MVRGARYPPDGAWLPENPFHAVRAAPPGWKRCVPPHRRCPGGRRPAPRQNLPYFPSGSIIQPELPVLQQITVIRLEFKTVVQFQGTFPVILEITDRIDRTVKIALTFEFTPYFRRLIPVQFLWNRHCFHVKRITLLDFQLGFTRSQYKTDQTHAEHGNLACQSKFFSHILFCLHLFSFVFVRYSFKSLNPSYRPEQSITLFPKCMFKVSSAVIPARSRSRKHRILP